MKQARFLKKVLSGVALLAAGSLTSTLAFAAGPYTITYFPANAYTEPYGINNLGQVVGRFTDLTDPNNPLQTGFLANSNGNITKTLLLPGTKTIAETINNNGQIVGTYDDNGVQRGFIYNNNTDTYRAYTAPVPNVDLTFLHYINDRGDFTGHYVDSLDGFQHNFIVTQTAGGEVFTPFDLPPYVTVANGMVDLDTYTNNGDRAGHYYDGGATNGFIFANGMEYYIDTDGHEGTELERMNNNLQAVGYLLDIDGMNHAFFLPSPDSMERYLLFNPSQWLQSWAEGINDYGVIVGYVDDGSTVRGFIATPGAAAVPEPSTLLLTGAGLAGLGLLARRRSRNS